jgi:D-alanine-D-alanine ligase
MSFEVNPDWWKSLFDEVYLLTDARSVDDAEVTRREVDVLCELLPLQPEHQILDLCGGQGRHSLELSRRGYGACTVLDYSEVLLERGRQKANGNGCSIRFIQGDAAQTELPDAEFDHVMILGNSLGYLPQTTDDLRIMTEARRMLKPEGYLLLDITDGAIIRERFNPNAWHEIEEDIVVCRQRELDEEGVKVREVVLCKERGLIRDQTYAIRTYSPERLQSLVCDAGFSDVNIHRNFSPQMGEGDYGFMNHRLLLTARG